MTPDVDAVTAAVVFAIDPPGVGGVLLQGPPSQARDDWLALLRSLLPDGTPLRRVPAYIGDERLLGGLDLTATLEAGRPVMRSGLLAEAHGGVILLAMAERLSRELAARLAAVMDRGQVDLQREAVATALQARLGVIALDEGQADDEQAPAALVDRLALLVPMVGRLADCSTTRADVLRARRQLPGVRSSPTVIGALCAAAQQLGIESLRAPWWAWRVACAACALRGAVDVSDDDAALAARLVLGPRATMLPPATPSSDEASSPTASDRGQPPVEPAATEPSPARTAPHDRPQDAPGKAEADASPPSPTAADHDQLLQSVLASLPAGMLALPLAARRTVRGMASAQGRSGQAQRSGLRGRPINPQRGELRAPARLDLLQTLRAAAPWQPARRRMDQGSSSAAILVRREDFHVRRFMQRQQTTTIFAVDASGSQALHRLGEAKGAVELLLAECYVRRDRVAVLAFRGRCASVLLPPTRSLVRAKRSLAGLPGGGGTPLAAGIDAARLLADRTMRDGGAPLLVLLTDGRANITRSGDGGRQQAQAEALAAARAWQQTGMAALLLDTAPQPLASTRTLAEAMGARYVALPCAAAHDMAAAVTRSWQSDGQGHRQPGVDRRPRPGSGARSCLG